MNIKEIEKITGMNRANIRFYESKGLLAPARNENGYREYTNEDLDVLFKIKLLRSIQISIDEIKSLQDASIELQYVLAEKLDLLESQQEQTLHAKDTCSRLIRDCVSYSTLDAKYYLKKLESFEQINPQTPIPTFSAQAEDVQSSPSPWRRYFARTMDVSLCSISIEIFLMLVFRYNPFSNRLGIQLIIVIISLILVIFVEPLLLKVFGTTPGKWITGMKVYNSEYERNPSYTEALSRTIRVMWYGMGFLIPVYHIIRLIKSYRSCKKNTTLRWEQETEIQLTDKSVIKASLLYIGTTTLIVSAFILSALVSQLPVNHGDLSISEFCENHNAYAKYYMSDTSLLLDNQGNWQAKPNRKDIYILSGEYKAVDYYFTENNGVLTQVEFKATTEKNDIFRPSCSINMMLAVLAFARAQPDAGLNAKEARDIVSYINKHQYEDFSFTIYGIDISCDVEMGIRENDESDNYMICFSMKKK